MWDTCSLYRKLLMSWRLFFISDCLRLHRDHRHDRQNHNEILIDYSVEVIEVIAPTNCNGCIRRKNWYEGPWSFCLQCPKLYQATRSKQPDKISSILIRKWDRKIVFLFQERTYQNSLDSSPHIVVDALEWMLSSHRISCVNVADSLTWVVCSGEV